MVDRDGEAGMEKEEMYEKRREIETETEDKWQEWWGGDGATWTIPQERIGVPVKRWR